MSVVYQIRLASTALSVSTHPFIPPLDGDVDENARIQKLPQCYLEEFYGKKN